MDLPLFIHVVLLLAQGLHGTLEDMFNNACKITHKQGERERKNKNKRDIDIDIAEITYGQTSRQADRQLDCT